MLIRMATRCRHIARFIDTCSTVTRGFRTSAYTGIMAPIKVGDSLPKVDLYDGKPDKKVNTVEAFGKGTHVIFAIPGAFTPTCQNEHFPTYLEDYDKLKAKGVDSVVCLSVNDPFVMEAFCKHLGAEGKIKCLADTFGEFTKAVDLALDLTEILGNIRSKRILDWSNLKDVADDNEKYAMVVKDGKVNAINIEESPGDATCSKASGILEKL